MTFENVPALLAGNTGDWAQSLLNSTASGVKALELAWRLGEQVSSNGLVTLASGAGQSFGRNADLVVGYLKSGSNQVRIRSELEATASTPATEKHAIPSFQWRFESMDGSAAALVDQTIRSATASQQPLELHLFPTETDRTSASATKPSWFLRRPGVSLSGTLLNVRSASVVVETDTVFDARRWLGERLGEARIAALFGLAGALLMLLYRLVDTKDEEKAPAPAPAASALEPAASGSILGLDFRNLPAASGPPGPVQTTSSADRRNVTPAPDGTLTSIDQLRTDINAIATDVKGLQRAIDGLSDRIDKVVKPNGKTGLVGGTQLPADDLSAGGALDGLSGSLPPLRDSYLEPAVAFERPRKMDDRWSRALHACRTLIAFAANLHECLEEAAKGELEMRLSKSSAGPKLRENHLHVVRTLAEVRLFDAALLDWLLGNPTHAARVHASQRRWGNYWTGINAPGTFFEDWIAHRVPEIQTCVEALAREVDSALQQPVMQAVAGVALRFQPGPNPSGEVTSHLFHALVETLVTPLRGNPKYHKVRLYSDKVGALSDVIERNVKERRPSSLNAELRRLPSRPEPSTIVRLPHPIVQVEAAAAAGGYQWKGTLDFYLEEAES